jgi:hypothetical protein
MSFSECNWEKFNGSVVPRLAWTCGGRSPTALPNGLRTAALLTTSSTRPAARQQSYRRSAPSGVLPQRWAHARCREGQALAAADGLDESGLPKTTALNALFALNQFPLLPSISSIHRSR